MVILRVFYVNHMQSLNFNHVHAVDFNSHLEIYLLNGVFPLKKGNIKTNFLNGINTDCDIAFVDR